MSATTLQVLHKQTLTTSRNMLKSVLRHTLLLHNPIKQVEEDKAAVPDRPSRVCWCQTEQTDRQTEQHTAPMPAELCAVTAG